MLLIGVQVLNFCKKSKMGEQYLMMGLMHVSIITKIMMIAIVKKMSLIFITVKHL